MVFSPSIQWFIYVAENQNIPIFHELQGDEYQVPSYSLDSYTALHWVKQFLNLMGAFCMVLSDVTMQLTRIL